ncbi:hypothetical protein AWW67_00075 [Roseivirga seohaensis]|uniref:Uncharacterized protein n=1 Tax=Roseivirga seohaensis TaxID=1914963 RepID=A0A150Y3T8_9BACT|nr:hypothetical protein [Roseivirga seohaensis]KYG85680.1 hypothetical protein AWW67_00075 [Roseivirga seohaensis]
MEPEKPSTDIPVPQNETLKGSIYHECRIMFDYVLKNGKQIDVQQVAPLEQDEKTLDSATLIGVYNYLAEQVKPALPGTLILFAKNKASINRFKFLGPLPIVRQFMVLCILSLISLILTSLSGLVSIDNIQMSMLQGGGWSQAVRFLFLMSAASVGAGFYALFEMNNYISAGTFDTKYSSTYWSRYVLGIVAGILLSELFVVFIGPNEQTKDSTMALDSATYLLKPILAILGGFSASLVYRILNRLISAVESIFTGSANQMIAQKKQEFDLQNQANEQQLKTTSAQNLLALKATLIANKVPQSVLDQVDAALGQIITVPPTPAPSQVAPAPAK